MSRFAVLQSGPFRRYLGGQLLSVTCSWIQVVALTSFVVGQDEGALALIVTLQFAPMLAAPLFGAVADRFDRRRLLMGAELGLATVALTYAALDLTGALGIATVAVVAAVWGVVNALDTPARQAFLTDLVPVEDAPRAAPLSGLVMLTGMAAGSALGAVGLGVIGFAACCFVNAGSFLADVLILRSLPVRPVERPAGGRSGRAVRQGLTYVRTTPALRSALAALAVTATLTFTFPVSVPLLAEHFDRSAVGLFMATTMGGSLLGMVVAAGRRPGQHLPLRPCALGLAAAALAVAVSPNLAGAAVALAALGAAWSIFLAAVLGALYQHASPPMIGRVMALFGMLLLGSTPVGSPVAGLLAGLAGARAPFVVGALAAVAVSGRLSANVAHAPAPSPPGTLATAPGG